MLALGFIRPSTGATGAAVLCNSSLQETLRRTDAMHLEAKNRAAQSEMKVLVASIRRMQHPLHSSQLAVMLRARTLISQDIAGREAVL